MPLHALSRDLRFPPVDQAEPDGLLAIGGDLRPERLLLAYREGIFPWYDDDGPLLWWSPDPRYLLDPGRIRVPKSLERVIRNGPWTVSWDEDFAAVIRQCRTISRKDQPGTWITPAMQAAYVRLHRLGYAHSVEVRIGRDLVGGLYGVALGHAFFGESMFARRSNASKVALVHLARALHTRGFDFIDCQVPTDHLSSFGAAGVPRAEFLARLRAALQRDRPAGLWCDWGVESSSGGGAP